MDGPRNWSGSITSEFDDDEEDDDEEEEDRSLDLLVRFVQNVFKKTSKRARKALRAILPISISTKLVHPLICTPSSFLILLLQVLKISFLFELL